MAEKWTCVERKAKVALLDDLLSRYVSPLVIIPFFTRLEIVQAYLNILRRVGGDFEEM